MGSGTNIVVYAGLLIGLVYGAVGLLSGFCLTSSLRGWWVEGDSRLIRTFALALGVAVAATQLLAGYGAVDLGKSVYLLTSISAPLMFFGGLLFGYGMVLANGCGSRALVLLGCGNLRSFVVVIVLGIAAQMTIRGLIAPLRSRSCRHRRSNRLTFRCRRCSRRWSAAKFLRASLQHRRSRRCWSSLPSPMPRSSARGGRSRRALRSVSW